MNATLLVLAAGMGSRYGGLKQMDPLGPNGETIIEYSVYDALRAGFDKVVFVIRPDFADLFREKVGDIFTGKIAVEYAHQTLETALCARTVPKERKKPWGTAHAVAACREAVRTPFAVINADDFYGPSAFRVLADFLGKAGDSQGVQEYCLVGYLLANTLSEHGHVSRGVCEVGPDGTLRAIRERVRIQRFGDAIRHTEDGEHWIDLPADSVVSMNMWGFTPGLFAELDAGFVEFLRARGSDLKAEYFLPERVGELVAVGRARVKVLRTGERWFGITYKEDKPVVVRAVRGLVEQGVYPPSLWDT
jgi:hypothetical protein